MKCNETSCADEATHVPKICVPATGWPIDAHQPLSAIMCLPLCRRHATEFRARETLELRGDRTMRTVFELTAQAVGGLPPDFARAFVVPVSLDSEEYLSIAHAREQRDQVIGHA